LTDICDDLRSADRTWHEMRLHYRYIVQIDIDIILIENHKTLNT